VLFHADSPPVKLAFTAVHRTAVKIVGTANGSIDLDARRIT
jgi:hypothetical protein